MQKGRAMVSHQGKIMTEVRPPLQKKPPSLRKNEDRLARALRENLHRRKHRRARAVAGVTDDPAAPSDTDAQNRSAGNSSNG